MANINFSQTVDNGQQFVITKEGLQGLASVTVTKITGPEAVQGGKSITIYKGDGNSTTIGVGSNIEFPSITTDDNDHRGTVKIQVDGQVQYASIVGITESDKAKILPATYLEENPETHEQETKTCNLGGSGDNEAWNCVYAKNLFINGQNITSFLPQSKGTTAQFWRGDANNGPGWSNELTGTLVLSNATDASIATANNPALIIGNTTTPAQTNDGDAVNDHLEFDGNEIICVGINESGQRIRRRLFLNTYNKDEAGNPTQGEFNGCWIDANGELTANKVHNAVFNDYAECRTTINLTPGHVVIDQDNGSLACSSVRLQPGAQVISDTYGTCMGETDTAKTPIAVAGRVLVYPYQSRENYHAGMAVCSAPDGTVDIMTREEIRDYPDCIVGIVSEIPEYETWGSDNVKVDGRIWIRVK